MLSRIKKIKTILDEYLRTSPVPHPLYIATSAYITGACYVHLSWIGVVIFSSLTIGMASFLAAQRAHYISIILLIITCFEFGFFRANYQIEKFRSIQNICAQGPFQLTIYVKNYKKLYDKVASCCITGIVIKAQHSKTLVECAELQNATVQLFCSVQQNVMLQDAIFLQNVSFSDHRTITPFALYLMRTGIDATAHCNKNIVAQHRSYMHSNLCIEELQQSIIEQLGAKIYGYSATLFNSIFLGYKDTTQRRFMQIRQQFRLWGVEHYLARSGLHMALLALLWMYLASLVPISLNSKNSIVLLCAGIYALYTTPSISFIRTFLFFCTYKTLALFDAPIHTFHLFVIIMVCVLIHNPLHLFFLDFQLSFILAGSLVWIHAIMRHKKQMAAQNS